MKKARKMMAVSAPLKPASKPTSETSGETIIGNCEAEFWNAVQARDRDFDGRFYYSVATTGVYCRPSCAARLAKRENVKLRNALVTVPASDANLQNHRYTSAMLQRCATPAA